MVKHQDHSATHRPIHHQGRRPLAKRHRWTALHGPALAGDGDEDDSAHDDVIIARDEKAANQAGECCHSVSVDVMITDTTNASNSRSSRVRKLSDKPSIELVVFHTAPRDKLILHPDPDAFLQMTYQGPKP